MALPIDPSLPLDQREALLNRTLQSGRTYVEGYNPLGYSSQGVSRQEADRQDAATEEYNRSQAAIGLAGVGLEKDIPRLESNFAERQRQVTAEVDPLKQRYDDLISRIRSNQTSAENLQLRATNSSLAKRGITGSSSLAMQTQADALNPIKSQYTGLEKDTVSEREAKLRDLSNQVNNLEIAKNDAISAAKKAIAELQITGSQQAAQTALNAYNQFKTLQAQQQQLEYQAQQSNIANSLAEREMQLKELAYSDSRADKEQPAGGGVAYSGLIGTSGAPSFMPTDLPSGAGTGAYAGGSSGIQDLFKLMGGSAGKAASGGRYEIVK